MLLIATFMFDPAKLATNWVRASGTRIVRGETADGPAADRTGITRCTVRVAARAARRPNQVIQAQESLAKGPPLGGPFFRTGRAGCAPTRFCPQRIRKRIRCGFSMFPAESTARRWMRYWPFGSRRQI